MDDNDRREAGRFLRLAALFAAPWLALLGLPSAVLLRSGELAPTAEVVRRQAGDAPVLFGPAYRAATVPYKLNALLARRPTLAVLGTSRSMQLRGGFVKEPASFYNAAGVVSHVRDYRAFLSHIPRAGQPELVVLGLDQNFLNPVWEDALDTDLEAQLRTDGAGFMTTLQSAWRKIYVDWWSGKFPLSAALADSGGRLGLHAIANGNGYRNDGSYRYGKALRHPVSDPLSEDYRFEKTLDKIAHGADRFTPGSELSAPALAEIDRLLGEFAARGIHVVGFLPPYPHAVHRRMTESGEFGYLAKIASALRPLFAARGFALLDFSDQAALDSPDTEALDGFHASETAYARLLLRLAEADPRLRRRVDVDGLSARLRGTPAPLSLLGD